MSVALATAAFQLLVAAHIVSISVGRGPPRLISESYQKRRVVRAGTNLRLVCPVESPPPAPIVTWSKDGHAVHLGWERYRVHSGVLRVRNLEVVDSGVYTCHATNGFGSIDVKYLVYVYGESNDTTLPPDDFNEDIFHPASADVAPQFKDRFLSDTLTPLAGATVQLSCSSVIARPPPKITWYKNGVELSHDDLLLIPEVTSADSGRYDCHVRNRAGSINRTFVVNVDVENAVKSVEIVHPYPENRTVSVSSSASFRCHVRVDTSSVPNIQWLKRVDAGDRRPPNTSITFSHDSDLYALLQTSHDAGISISSSRQQEGSYISRLTLSRVRSTDAGLYVCVVTGRYQLRSYRPVALTVYTAAGDGTSGFRASFHGIDRLSLMPIIAGSIAIVVIILIATVILIICRRRSKPSKATAAGNAVGGLSSTAAPGTAASSALLAGQRASCGSSVTDKRQLHHQYAELRERPSAVPALGSRLTRPSPSPPATGSHLSAMTAPTANVGSAYSSYSSISKTPAAGASSLQPHHPYQHQQLQQAYQMQPQLPHLHYFERC